MPIETLNGAPEPEDNRTPEQKWEDHLKDIRRDSAVGERVWQESESRRASIVDKLLPPKQQIEE